MDAVNSALSGLNSSSQRLKASASNIANAQSTLTRAEDGSVRSTESLSLDQDAFDLREGLVGPGEIEQADLDRDATGLTDIRAVIGLGGGQALDVAKWFAWRRNLPLFQAPTALSVNAVYSHRSGVRDGGKVIYRGYAVPECVFIDYDVLRAAPRHLNWSGIGDILCFRTGVLDWQYARDNGKAEAKWPYDPDLAAQSLSKVQGIIDNIDGIRMCDPDPALAALVPPDARAC
jgi:glycerol dehydrogenase-like iron-containing ADH family enzyme